MEVECTLADRKLHEAETNSTSLKSQLKTKREELKGTIIPGLRDLISLETGLEKKLKDGLGESTTVEAAIKDVTKEINFLRESVFLLAIRMRLLNLCWQIALQEFREYRTLSEVTLTWQDQAHLSGLRPAHDR